MSRRPCRVLVGAVIGAVLLLPLLSGTPPTRADGINKLMLVMDSSGSMKESLPGGSSKISAARSALNTVISGLPGTQQVGLRVYGAKVFDKADKGACTDSQRVVDLDTDNRSELRTAVGRYRPYGETPTGYALAQAGKDLGTDGQRTIVLVSDGESTCAPDPCKVAGSLAQKGFKLRIEVVGLGVSGKARNTLRCVARAAHGHYYDADDASDLTRALDTVATRSARPYKPSGRPIVGGTSAPQATPLAVGDWVDRLGGVDQERGELFYTVRRSIPGSTFHISAALINKTDDYDGLTVELSSGGERCGSDGQALNGGSGPIVSVAFAAPGPLGWNEECRGADYFTVEISRGVNHSGDGLAATVPVEIRVTEEAPAGNDSELPDALPRVAHQQIGLDHPVKIAGGSSFAEATGLSAGSYRGSIVPGELQLFSIPVGWGQHLDSRLRIPELTGRLADEMDDGGPELNLRLFSPSRAPAELLEQSSPSSTLEADGTEIDSVSAPVVYRGRTSNEERIAAASEAGRYYLAVSLAADDGKSYQVPYALGVAVDGTVRGKPIGSVHRTPTSPNGTPTPGTPTPVPSASPVAPSGQAASPQPAAAENSSAGLLARTVAIMVGTLGVIAVTGGLIMIIRRSR
ncbi:vWA domain-containing protein [Microlunatus soli]|uniref:Ca-activated chloride channel family protein n=1 Tax=Microlunatus soli TaxID=630515 RepID=A0A1H1NKY5_9ACTN|nr:VWA domain-containing protein [Microlunatus soli]SDR99652.1 Ca-activated chloride channel family protein [Microlunatus soli]